jgi:hypothetical protein
MCGSRIEAGRVIVTTPSASCHVGQVFFVIGSAAEFAGEPADWGAPALEPGADEQRQTLGRRR